MSNPDSLHWELLWPGAIYWNSLSLLFICEMAVTTSLAAKGLGSTRVAHVYVKSFRKDKRRGRKKPSEIAASGLKTRGAQHRGCEGRLQTHTVQKEEASSCGDFSCCGARDPGT